MSLKHNIENDKWFLEKAMNKDIAVRKNGEIINLKTMRHIGSIGSGGYLKISIKDFAEMKIRSMQVHRLIWIFFRGMIPNSMQINHEDGNKLNNKLSNLSCVTQSENIKHAFRNGLNKQAKGELNHQSKLKDNTVKILREKFIKCKFNIASVARNLGVTRSCLQLAIAGKTFTHV